MKRTRILFLLLGLLLLMSCNDPKHITDALHHAEALMNETPDSAWAVLNTLSPDEMGQNRTRALYALLYSQAQDKTYRDETNDSLISVAVDYYRDSDDVRCKFLSFYYKGRVHFNAKDYLNATTCYMEAEQLVNKLGDDYLAGLLYSELGRIYRLYYDYPKSMEAHQKAAEYYERAGKIRHRNYMWYNQSLVCRNMDQNDESERLLRMTLASAKEEKDTVLVGLCMGDLVMLCIEEERVMEAQVLYAEFELVVDEDLTSSSFLSKLSKMYLFEKDYIRAKQCVESGWKCAINRRDSINLFFASAEIMSVSGKVKEAYQELMRGVALQNDEARQALQQPVLTAQRDYLSEKLEFEAYKLRMRKLLNLLTTLFFLLLLGVLVYVFVRIFRKHKKESQQMISHLESEKHKAEEESNAKIADLNVQLQNKKQSIEELKRTLEQRKENSDAEISALLERMEQERTIAHQMIQTQNEVLVQKEENRKSQEILIQKLESDCKLYMETACRFGSELKILQDENKKMMFQKVELLKNVLEQVVEVVLLHERKYLKEEMKIRRIEAGIKSLKIDYYAGDDEYNKVEALVNRYLDNVMEHFRREVKLTNESEYRRVCYMFAGVSGKIIGEIMGESKDAVYQRRSRLLKKIGSLSCTHKEMFIILLLK